MGKSETEVRGSGNNIQQDDSEVLDPAKLNTQGERTIGKLQIMLNEYKGLFQR